MVHPQEMLGEYLLFGGATSAGVSCVEKEDQLYSAAMIAVGVSRQAERSCSFPQEDLVHSY
jgi:hypothetical protein